MFDSILITALAGFLAGYLVGSVPVGVLVSRAYGVNIRSQGTGNVGAANVRKSVGRAAAAMVALGIFLQGLLPPLVTRLISDSETLTAAAAVGPVVGYGWPLFAGFRGGRGLGVSTGAAAALSSVGFIILLLCYSIGALTRQSPAAVLAGFIIYAGYIFYSTGSAAYQTAAIALVALIVVRRMEGIMEELRHGPVARVVLDLLVFQRRPERRGSR